MKFYKNKITGNFEISNNDNLENDSNYKEVKVGSVDASLEKHVPIYQKSGDKIKVEVGSTMHPMEEEHYIMWIVLVKDNEILERVDLKPGDIPVAEFNYIDNSTIYACCNLHGIWKCDVK